MFKVNVSHLNKTVMLKILHAIRITLSGESINSFVLNKKGKSFIEVRKVIDQTGKIKFTVKDSTGQNLRFLLGKAFILKNNDDHQGYANLDGLRGIAKFIQTHLTN